MKPQVLCANLDLAVLVLSTEPNFSEVQPMFSSGHDRLNSDNCVFSQDVCSFSDVCFTCSPVLYPCNVFHNAVPCRAWLIESWSVHMRKVSMWS